jgi:hypothetical protein
MAAVTFTDREMTRAWRENLKASSHTSRTNAHRLLLFYAVECGLKAVLMKRQSVTCTNHCMGINEAQHNINKLLDDLMAGKSLKLPTQFNMTPINEKNGVKQERSLSPGQINQLLRYGGKIEQPINFKEKDLENRLIEITKWIEGELNQ